MDLGPHKDREKLWPGRELNPWPSIRSPLLYWLSYKVEREQVVGIEDVNFDGNEYVQAQGRVMFLQTLAV